MSNHLYSNYTPNDLLCLRARVLRARALVFEYSGLRRNQAVVQSHSLRLFLGVGTMP